MKTLAAASYIVLLYKNLFSRKIPYHSLCKFLYANLHNESTSYFVNNLLYLNNI